MPMRRMRHNSGKKLSVEDLTTWTNLKAILNNAGTGGGIYPKFVPFSIEELASHLGLNILSGISPTPQVDLKFASQSEDPVNGSDLCNEIFNGKEGARRHREFKTFFASVDPRYATPSRATHPNWKVDPMLMHAMGVCKNAMHMGKYISIDEQTIGFQGRHADKICVMYKNAGDGFQADAICADGYTFNWYFSNHPTPPKYLNEGFSPLSSRVLSLLSQLPGKNYACGMDNLYMSTKLSRACYCSDQKVMTHGVTRSSGRGLPKCIMQEEVTRKEDLQKQRGTLKVAQLVNDPACNGFLSLSLYNQKPVYLLSNVCNNVEWVKKERIVWHKVKGKR